MDPNNYASYTNTPSEPEVNFKKVIAIILAGLSVLALLYFVFSFGILTLTATSPDGKDVAIIKSELVDNPARNSGVFGTLKSGASKTVLVRRGSYEFSARSGDATSSKAVSVGLFRVTKARIDLAPQKKVSKVGTDSMGCSTYVSNIVYSYSCSSDSGLFRHTNLTSTSFSEKTPVYAAGQKKQLAQNYEDGLLETVFESGEDGEAYILQYRNLINGQAVKVAFPDEYFSRTPSGLRTIKAIVTDQSFKTRRFAVVLFDNSILLYNDTSDSQPKKVTPDFTKTGLASTSLSTNFTLDDKSLYVFAGREDTSIDSDDEAAEYKKYKGGFIDQYSLSSDLQKPLRRIVIGKDVQGSQATIFANDRFVILTRAGLRVFEIKGSKLGRNVLRVPAQNYEITQAGSALLIGNENTVSLYRADGNELQGVFFSDNVRFSSFSSNKSTILFNGVTNLNDSLSITQVYVMDLQSNQVKQAPELVLPYRQSKVPIQTMDFLGNLVVIKPTLQSLEFIGLPAPEYDADEYQKVTSEINAQLARDGITSSSYTIVYKVL